MTAGEVFANAAIGFVASILASIFYSWFVERKVALCYVVFARSDRGSNKGLHNIFIWNCLSRSISSKDIVGERGILMKFKGKPENSEFFVTDESSNRVIDPGVYDGILKFLAWRSDGILRIKVVSEMRFDFDALCEFENESLKTVRIPIYKSTYRGVLEGLMIKVGISMLISAVPAMYIYAMYFKFSSSIGNIYDIILRNFVGLSFTILISCITIFFYIWIIRSMSKDFVILKLLPPKRYRRIFAEHFEFVRPRI